MKRREGRKLLSILLTLALVFSMIPGMSLTAYADDDISYEDLDNITTPEYFDSGEWYPVDNDDDTETVLSEECIEADTTASGTAVITAEAENGVKASITITVVNPKTEVKSVEIDKTSVKKDAKPGDTFRLTAVIKPDEATDKTVTWESDKPEVAEVGEYTGIVTVKKTGDAKITVWAARGTLSDTLSLTSGKYQ